MRVCQIPGCGRPLAGRGWCQPHYARWYNHGDPLAVPIFDSPEERFWAKVDKGGPVPAYRPDLGPCWLWTGSRAGRGYGHLCVGRKDERRWVQAHRRSYEILVGPIPVGLVVDHLCRVPLCVNPTHLEPVTTQENTHRGIGHGKETHCPQGHPYTEENTYVDPRNRRTCRTCLRFRAHKRRSA